MRIEDAGRATNTHLLYNVYDIGLIWTEDKIVRREERLLILTYCTVYDIGLIWTEDKIVTREDRLLLTYMIVDSYGLI